jgi:quinol monooxygenase YgiN
LLHKKCPSFILKCPFSEKELSYKFAVLLIIKIKRMKLGLLVRLQAKTGKEQEVANFITNALPLAIDEPETITWYAIKIDSSTFGIFDTFPHEEGRQAHLTGKIANALMANASELLAQAPTIEKVEILASKKQIN